MQTTTESSHDQIRELLPGYALGILTPEEHALVASHLATCTTCATELSRHRIAALALTLAAPEREPPSRLRSRLQRAVRSSSQPAVPSRAERWRSWLRQRAVLGWGLATVAVVAVIALAVWNVTLLHQLQRDEYRVVSGSVTAHVRYFPSDRVLVIDLRGLPDPPPGTVYQVWAIPSGTPVPMGTLPDSASRIALIGDPSQLGTLAITVEPGPLGSPQPTSAPLVTIDLRNQRGTTS